MKTKNGTSIPADLSAALGKDKEKLSDWNKLRPSCQAEYLDYLEKAKTGETRSRYLQRILRMTADYAKRHPGKYRAQKGPAQ